MTNVLETRDLCCGYGPRRVLDAVSLSVREGEVLVLLGPNGSGKTTLLRALARLLRPTGGTVRLLEKDVWSQSPADFSQRLALMPQNERRDWPLTVEETVWLGRAPHRGWLLPFREADKSIIEIALHQTGLEALRTRPITELSGGEWRRTILARALAQQTRALLLDEPTAGLDLKYQVEVLRLVRRLAATEKLAVVITLHDLNLAAIYADRIALLSDHALSACGTAEEVLTAERIGRAYDVAVTVTRHPVHGTPLVVPLPESATQEEG